MPKPSSRWRHNDTACRSAARRPPAGRVRIGRRDFLRNAAAGAGGLVLGGLPLLGRAQPPLTATGLADGVIQVSGAGGNVVLVGGQGEVAMIDSGVAESAHRLAELVSSRFGALPALLFNTHWHLEHTGGNDLFGAEGPRIVAHENTRLWMSTEFYVKWQDRTYPPRAPHAQPTSTFYSSDPQPIEVVFAGERIQYGHLREAHTDGDIYVFLPERNVIVAGGAVSVGEYPVLDYITGGWIGGLIEATETLLGMSDDRTLIVPQAGPAQSREHLEAQHAMLSAVRRRVEEMAIQGKSAAEMLAAGVTAEFDDRWGNNAERFLHNVYDGLWWGDRLRGIIA